MSKIIDYVDDTDARNRLKYITRIYIDKLDNVCTDRCRVIYANKDLIYFKKPDGGSMLDYVHTRYVYSSFDEAVNRLGEVFINKATIYCVEQVNAVDIDLEWVKLKNEISKLKFTIRTLNANIQRATEGIERSKIGIDHDRDALLIAMQRLANAEEEYNEKYGKDDNKDD